MLFLSARRRLRPVALLSTLALAGGAAVAALPVLASPAQAAPTELFFSEYVEGTSNNKALEIYNGTGAPADLAAGGYNVAMFFNGATTASLTINLTGTVAAGDVFVLAQSTASAAILAQADQTNGSGWFNGDDAIVLRKGTTVVDSIGQTGFDPGSEWGTGLASTADNTLRRTTSVTEGDTTPGDVFDPSVGWDGFATDTFDGLGAHSTTTADAAPAVSSTTPTNGATEQSVVSNVTVRFSEPVATSAAAFALSCTSTGAHGVAVAGGPQSWTVNPTTNLGYGESCTLTVSAAGVSDVDADDPPDAMVADFTTSFGTVSQNPCSQSSTPVYEIQGDTDDSPKQGQALVTSGVVSAVLPDLSGFSLQDPTGDGNEATSDGVFVFLPSANPVASLLPTLAPGDSVTLAGTPKEFQGQTEIDNVTALEECSDPVGAPAPVTVHLPETVNGELERFEGALVTIPDTLTVQQNFFLGRYGQLTLGSGGRLYQPTNLDPAGSPAALARAADNAKAMVVLDDARSQQNPAPVPYLSGPGTDGTRRPGDTTSGLTGVLDFGQVNSNAAIRDYRLQPTETPAFAVGNPRTAAPAPVGGNLEVASFNVLNYFTTLATSSSSPARGANTQLELDRQRAKMLAAMSAIDADVFGLMEIENLPGTDAVGDLVTRLNATIAATGGPANTYAAVPEPTGPGSGTGSDAIKVAMIYKTATVAPVAGQVWRDNDPINNRPTLAATMKALRTGETLNVVVNHFKSKGSCPAAGDPGATGNTDSGDGQGCWNAQRVQQAERLLQFLGTVQTSSGEPDSVVIGDLNSYGKEDPILALQAGGLQNQIERYVGDEAYSYVFDGLAGYLDHGLVTSSLAGQMTGATEWHINADEPSVIDYNTEFKPDDRYAPTPYRSSDHDPVVLGIDLGGCVFDRDAAAKVMTLTRDCWTSRTIAVDDGWTLDGDGHTIRAYDAAGDHFRGAVVANGGAVAHVRDVTVTADRLADVCDGTADRLRGILLEGASGSVTGTRVTGVKQAGSGCQEGNGIEVRNAPFTTGGVDKVVTVSGNEIRDYQKGGIVANGSVAVTVTGNTVVGAGRVGYLAQNGVQLAYGATGSIDGNTVRDNFYTGADLACGLLIFEADGVKQKRNLFSGNEQDVCNFGRGGGSVPTS